MSGPTTESDTLSKVLGTATSRLCPDTLHVGAASATGGTSAAATAAHPTTERTPAHRIGPSCARTPAPSCQVAPRRQLGTPGTRLRDADERGAHLVDAVGSIHATGAAGATGATGPASGSSVGMRSSHLGRYQFQSPSSVITAGSRTARTMVASIKTATARPTPIILMSIALRVAKMEKIAIITTAALVMTPALDLMPWLIASSLLSPR